MTDDPNYYGAHLERAIRDTFDNAATTAQSFFSSLDRPSVKFRPRIFIDGNMWCALYGDNIQDGVAGFGESPAAAMWDFDLAWEEKLESSKVVAEVMKKVDDLIDQVRR